MKRSINSRVASHTRITNEKRTKSDTHRSTAHTNISQNGRHTHATGTLALHRERLSNQWYHIDIRASTPAVNGLPTVPSLETDGCTNLKINTRSSTRSHGRREVDEADERVRMPHKSTSLLSRSRPGSALEPTSRGRNISRRRPSSQTVPPSTHNAATPHACTAQTVNMLRTQPRTQCAPLVLHGRRGRERARATQLTP